MTQDVREEILKKIDSFNYLQLRTLIVAFKQCDDISGDPEYVMEKDLVFYCLVGIKDPLRPGVKEAIKYLYTGGVRTIMVTGDDLVTAVAICKEAGIIPYGVINIKKYAVEGSEIRDMSDDYLDELLDTLCCVARCQPTDKLRVVKRLQALGKVVGATGDGTNDAPQLKQADVGFSMGIAGTDIAKMASDIIIMDDNFCSIVQAVRWGRSVLYNIRKFVQFYLTVNIVALVIAFVGSAVLSASPLTAIYLLYVNLIMDSLGSLALATEGPSKDILTKPPIERNASIITPGMLRNAVAMGCYYLLIILLMLFDGVGDTVCQTPAFLFSDITGTISSNDLDKQRKSYRYTSIYNFFIFAQIFNEFNSRRYGNELNVFAGLRECPLFVIVVVGTTIVQFVIMFVPGIRGVFKIYSCTSGCSYYYYGISWQTWLIDVLLGLLYWLVGLFLRMIKVRDEFPRKQKAQVRVVSQLKPVRAKL